jgi:hypothetical protein
MSLAKIAKNAKEEKKNTCSGFFIRPEFIPFRPWRSWRSWRELFFSSSSPQIPAGSYSFFF